tara:strand:- start:4375 stop:4941 length:567 start_codon:yes stop_codon:yes gene_type:complete
MKNILITAIAFLFIFTACSPSEQEQAQQDERQMQLQSQVVESSSEFNQQMSAVLDHYFDLKNALVESDAAKATTSAELLLMETDQVDASSLDPGSASIWDSYREIISGRTEELIPLTDVEQQRYQFEYISVAMIDMVEMFQPVGYEIYHQTCPMVRGGSADWLSREEQIENPYHGDRMMNCGEVLRRI